MVVSKISKLAWIMTYANGQNNHKKPTGRYGDSLVDKVLSGTFNISIQYAKVKVWG